MAPRRGRIRAAQAQVQQHVHSDYDTDTANNLAEMAAPAPIPPRTNEELNLSVLKRHDPSIIDVLSVANFAVVYLFSPTSQQWEKCGVEGTMFVCELQPQDLPGSAIPVNRYSVLVLNRKGLDNFSTELFSSDDVEITDEYVILQVEAEDGTPSIYGLWIFSEPPPSSTTDTRKINADVVYQCALKAERSRAVAEEQATQAANIQSQLQHSAFPPAAMMGQAAPQPDMHAPAGRQISVNDLFAQPRQQMPYFAEQPMHPNHGPHPTNGQHYPTQASDAQLPLGGFSGQPDVLGQLFRNAKQGYSG